MLYGAISAVSVHRMHGPSPRRQNYGLNVHSVLNMIAAEHRMHTSVN
jgi:hypothetical protein